MAALTSRREIERHQLRQKQVEAATQQQMLGQQQRQQQVQKQPSPPPSANDRQWSPPPSYSQSSYSPVLRDNIYQHLTQAEQVIFERGLDDYEQRKNLVGFVECLRVILNTNQKRQLIFAIREYAVRSSDYKKFNKLLVNYGIAASVATTHSQPKPVKKKSDLATSGVHKIEIKKDLNGDWGFNIRGGSEHGVGIFVSWVNPGSDAMLKGLKVGDQILKANDVNFEGISHQAAVQIMSSVKKLRLFVLSKGVVPHTQVNPQQSFVWVDVNGQSCTPPMTRHGRRGFQSEADERKITLVVEPGKQLGISIRGGSEHGLGIYISEVDDGSVADTYGLKAGDQILEVNGTSFVRILHSEAAKILKTNTMLIIVVKDVGKLPHARATTQTQWHSSQPNSIPVNRMKHPSNERSGFKHDIGKQVMHDQYSGHPSLTIMKDKAKSVLSESEWKTFNYYITQYKQHKLRVEDLAIALIDLLDTTEKYKLIAEIRSIIFPKDMNTFNKLTVHKEMLTRKGQYNFQEATKFGGSQNSLTSSSANSGSQDSITQNARAILDNFTLQSRDSDSAESDDGGFGSGGIQLKSYVQNSSNDNMITPERYASNTSKTETPKFFAPPPPSTPPTTSTPQSDNLQDILTDTLKERRKQLHPKDSLMDSSQDDTLNASTFSNPKVVVPHVVVTGSQESLSAVIQESVRREREEKMIREQREKERRFQEAKERRRMESDRETQQNLEDKVEEIEARIKKEYEMALEKEREKLAKLQKQEIERREELDRLENERKRQSRANFQESVRSELESEIRQEYEKTLKVEKEEKEQLQFILSQQKINEEAIIELETKIREDIQRQARDEFEHALQKEREEMQKREQAERKRREEIEEAQKRMEIERLEAEEQMRIEIEERVAKEAEERARLEYEERLQRETAERARLAEEIKTHKEIEERLEQQIQQQKEEMERQIAIALEKERAEELIEKERITRAAENEMAKAAEQASKQKQMEEKRRREEEQRKREHEAAEQKRREEEQRKREQEAAEQKRREEEQRKREREAAEQKRREEEQRKREREAAEQKRREEEQRKQAAEQKRREEEQRKREEEEAEQKRREEIEEQQLEQLLLLDTNDLQETNATKKATTPQITDKDTAIQEDRERAEKMLQQRMLMAKQKGASKTTSASKEGGMSYAKQAGVVGKKGFSYAGYTGLVGDMITVTITKVTKRLGIAVNGGAETRQVAVRIKEIIPGESAALTGQGLRVGQQILQVNSTSMKGLKHKEAVLSIKNAFSNAEKTMNIVVLDPDDDD